MEKRLELKEEKCEQQILSNHSKFYKKKVLGFNLSGLRENQAAYLSHTFSEYQKVKNKLDLIIDKTLTLLDTCFLLVFLTMSF